jgi:hypothetical protein
MSFLSKLFNYVPTEERKGIVLSERSCWEINGLKDLPSFLRELSYLIPLDSVLYLEGGDTPKELRIYLKERIAKEICKVEMGTIWPRPQCFHMQITYENLEGLAKLAENYATPEVAIHFHVYKNRKMLLMWYDAFFDPLYISREISEDKIRNFCDRLRVEYKEFNENK